MSAKSFKFTKSKIEGLLLPDNGERAEYRDTELSGLILRVTANGVKTFSLSRKIKGEHFRVTLGRFPDITVDVARASAVKYLSEMTTSKKNPNDTRLEKEKSKITLIQAIDEYILNRGDRVKPSTEKQYRAILQNFSGDWLKQPIASITRDRVENRHKAITEGSVWFGADRGVLRKGIGTGSRSQADLWARSLRAVYRFSHDHFRDEEGKTLLPDPPTTVLSTKRKWHGTVRKTARIRSHDFERWLSAIKSVRTLSEQSRDDIAVSVCDAVEMAIFTGLRKSEIFGLAWDRVNMGGGYFWIDTTKNGDPLELPITSTLRELFRRRLQCKTAEEILVFPGAKGQIKECRHIIDRITAASVPQNNIDNLSPIPFKWHDARRTYGTVAELVGVGSYILKRLMNHRTMRSADVTQGYLYFSADELQEPAKKIEQSILESAGLIVSKKSIDAQLVSALDHLNEDEKRKLIFSIMQSKKEKRQ
ncbi:integrase family protein [Rosenbergiella collisarenosi]|uniref:integrase family protein n=1 Tax=Rosenbergiella collisarenosi TaxID=1544695 RepID=UPI001F4DBF37|nr:integrase family protein [Rosenbergiella collisarenosi]